MVNEYVKGKPFFTSKSTYNQYNYLSEDIETELLVAVLQDQFVDIIFQKIIYLL